MARAHGRTDRNGFGIWTGGAVALIAALAWLAAPAGAEGKEHAKADAGKGRVVQVITTNIQGKNVYIPSTIAVEKGEETTLSIFNTTDVPHGFRIADLGVEVVLQPGQETVVKLPKVKKEGLHLVDCQLHPAHRTATLLVVD